MTDDILLVGEKQPKETRKAIIACNDYLRMGIGRSLRGLAEKYSKVLAEGEQNPPTTREATLFKWSSSFGWVERSRKYDTMIEQEKNERRKEIMESGLALDYERVSQLKQLAGRLIAFIEENDIWRKVPMKVGRGENATVVDVTVYNKDMLYDLRGLMDDLAKETGGRVNKNELGALGGGPIKVSLID